ncbi:DUF4362 domain-containing protein [Peribacillus kribbensis]|uniref:DUF4362 domain-containing protein n=1 Tax=Peribacillus kribbensis TaxID=356658 RepID=UPI0004080AF2|nr:DUF4362 domain-containing protein [Peribacillus kribbensis]
MKTKHLYIIGGFLLIAVLFFSQGGSLLSMLGETKQASADSKPSMEVRIKEFGKKETNQAPTPYTRAESLENGDITPSKITKEQRERINTFLENVKKGKPDFLRFAQFTHLDKAFIITEYQYNGDLIYYFQDQRLKTGKHEVTEDYCRNLEEKTKPWKGKFLTQCYKSKGVIEF